MKQSFNLITLCFVISSVTFAQEWKPQEWPVLKKYDKDHLYQIALPLGLGILLYYHI